MASVRFICGTQRQHTDLERRIADFLGMEAAILYFVVLDANGGVFEVLFGAEDAIISDELNHVDHRRHPAVQGDALPLQERRPRRPARATRGCRRRGGQAQGHRHRRRLLDGRVVRAARGSRDLADEFGALVFVDDSHAVGPTSGSAGAVRRSLSGAWTGSTSSPAPYKALGGASGVMASHQEVVDPLRQRSRPYLFSPTLSPLPSWPARCGRSVPHRVLR